MKRNSLKTAVYCRLSIEDKVEGKDSQSIQYQREIISKYAENEGFDIVDYYIDDGFSGTTFDRPAFNKMIEDIEKGLIDIVITKDLSRLGRDYLKAGYYIDTYFPSKNVRFIAISDNVDTSIANDDLIPFKNIINEMYARDVSKKIRFTLLNHIKAGVDSVTSIPLYGYAYENNKRIINEETSSVVRLIFSLYLEGNSPSAIANILEEKKILTPKFYLLNKHHLDIYENTSPYHWSKRTINAILENISYTGVLIRGKYQSKFKSKSRSVSKDEDCYFFKDKFPSIIDEDTFNKVQEMKEIASKGKYYRSRYRGKCFCTICKKPLRHKVDVRRNSPDYVRLTCQGVCSKEKGTILYEELDKYLKHELLNLKEKILERKDEFIQVVKKKYKSKGMNEEYRSLLSEKEALNKNIVKIDKYIISSFEHFSNGLILESTYQLLSSRYTKEKEILNNALEDINTLINKKKVEVIDIDVLLNTFINTISSLNHQSCLINENIDILISKIYIKTDGIKKRRERMQKEINIIYKYFDEVIKEFVYGKC